MPIEYTSLSIFDTGAQALVCPVNCVGVMGAGLAKQFKETFPFYFADYKEACKRKHIQLGQVYPWGYTSFKSLVIFSFPTKYHWRDKSYYVSIQSGLEDLVRALRTTHPVKSIALPALGCGLGGLKWGDVGPLIEEYLRDVEGCRVIVCEPRGAK